MKKLPTVLVSPLKVFYLVSMLALGGCHTTEYNQPMIEQPQGSIVEFHSPDITSTLTYDIMPLVDQGGKKLRIMFHNKERYNNGIISNFETYLQEGPIDNLYKLALNGFNDYLQKLCLEEAFKNLNRFFKKKKESNINPKDFVCPECNKEILQYDSSEFLLYPNEFMKQVDIRNYNIHCPCMKQIAHYRKDDVIDVPLFTMFNFKSFTNYIKEDILIVSYLNQINKYSPDKKLSELLTSMMSFFILERMGEINEKLCAGTLDALLSFKYEVLNEIYKLQSKDFLEMLLYITLNAKKNTSIHTYNRDELFSYLCDHKTHPIFELLNDKIRLITIHCLWQGFDEEKVDKNTLKSFLKTFKTNLKTLEPTQAHQLAMHYQDCPTTLRLEIEKSYNANKLDIHKASFLLSCKDLTLVTKIIEYNKELSQEEMIVLIKHLHPNKALCIVDYSGLEYLSIETINLINNMSPTKFKKFIKDNKNISLWTIETLEAANNVARTNRIFSNNGSPIKNNNQIDFSTQLTPHLNKKDESIDKKRTSREHKEKASTLSYKKSMKRERIRPTTSIEKKQIYEEQNYNFSTIRKDSKPDYEELRNENETRDKKNEFKLVDVGVQSFRESEEKDINHRKTKKLFSPETEARLVDRETKTAYFGTNEYDTCVPQNPYRRIEPNEVNFYKNFPDTTSYNNSPNHNEPMILQHRVEYQPQTINYNTGRFVPAKKINFITNEVGGPHNSNYTYNKASKSPQKFIECRPITNLFFSQTHCGLKTSQIPVAMNENEKMKLESILNLEEVKKIIPRLQEVDKYFFLLYLLQDRYSELNNILATSHQVSQEELNNLVRTLSYKQPINNTYYTHSRY